MVKKKENYLKNIIILLITLVFVCCGKDKINLVMGQLNENNVLVNDFKKELSEKYAYNVSNLAAPYKKLVLSEYKKAVRNELRQIFKDFYTSYAYYQEALEYKFLSKTSIVEKINEVKKDIMVKYLGKVLWEREIKPKISIKLSSDIADEDFKPFYRKLKVRHILILKSKRSESGAFAEIVKIKGKIKKVEQFKDFALKYSEDPGSKHKGGDLGWVNKTAPLVNEFKKALFNGKINEVIGPVKTAYGYHLILIEDEKKLDIQTLKKDISFINMLKKRKEGLVRQKSIEKAEEYMVLLREKYKDKFWVKTDKIKLFINKFHKEISVKYPGIIKNFKKLVPNPKNENEKIQYIVALKEYVSQYYPEIFNEYIKKAKKIAFAKVKNISQLFVDSIFRSLSRDVPASYLVQPHLLENFIYSRFIDHGIRYYEGIAKGYDKDEMLLKKIKFSMIHFKGTLYRDYLVKEFQNKVKKGLSDKILKEKYEKEKKSYERSLPNELDEADFFKQVLNKFLDKNEQREVLFYYKKNSKNKYVLKKEINQLRYWGLLEKVDLGKQRSFDEVRGEIIKDIVFEKEKKYFEGYDLKILKKYKIGFNVKMEAVNLKKK